jgi:hypothetical protein
METSANRIKLWHDITEDAAAARFLGVKVALLRKAAKDLGPGVRMTGKAGRTATFLGKHPDPDYWGAFWWRIAEPTGEDVRQGRSPAAQRASFDSTEALRFLALLGIDPGQAWFRSIGLNWEGERCANLRRRGADLQGFNADALQADISNGQAPYLVIGSASQATGKKGGVTDSDVATVPALWVEWDDLPEEEQKTAWRVLGLPEPSVMVSTGGKSVHCYWVLQEALQPEEWRPVQTRLIEHCGSDPACKNPARVMRLPGCPYIDKKTGRPTERRCEVIASPATRYSLEAILAALPAEAPAPVTQALAPSPAYRCQGKLPPRSVAEVEDAAQHIPPRVRNQGTYPSDRNALCGCAAALAEAGHPSPEEHALALLGNRWPSKREARQVLESTTTRKAGSFWAIAQMHGYHLRRTHKGEV